MFWAMLICLSVCVFSKTNEHKKRWPFSMICWVFLNIEIMVIMLSDYKGLNKKWYLGET